MGSQPPVGIEKRTKAKMTVLKRSIMIAGHATSISLEPAFWDALKELAYMRGISINRLIEEIDQSREGNLSSAVRVHVLNAYRSMGRSQ